ncbi:hypothetical protein [Clostridium beijerinckii]|uniref:Uncharacterized protein n=1 Tax=Clostridium beijerinckii TaxID=1520 RepID=A0AAW3W2F7_CLOBE|nr:hypothetical protein [Clostridium beijerinckii]MBC2455658.1 hypothetical protein [Clostridium beijerinckii]MBC2473135.1 hypothetical protein [Clostridium beijerinckii]NOV62361.1 hypothetical protein [Clostridium beijerinckii]NOV68142.1 hypothetical protein [Clostridium beijerinckii]NOW30413.1 hypothetical protein [Clostridium beijerinckii]
MIRNAIFSSVEWFKRASILTKFVICLCIVQSIFNIGGNIYTACKVKEVNITINQQIDGKKEMVTQSINNSGGNEVTNMFNELLDVIGKLSKQMFFIIITAIVSYFVYIICKFLELFRDLAELFAELERDGSALKFILIYDVIGFLWDLNTIYGFINY